MSSSDPGAANPSPNETVGFGPIQAAAEDARTSTGRGPLVLAVAVGVLLLVGAAIWSAYTQGVRERDAPPRITADAGPYKVRPEDPGGTVTPDLDKSVYDLLETPSDDAATAEPAPEPEPALRVAENADAAPAGVRIQRDPPADAPSQSASASDESPEPANAAALVVDKPADQPPPGAVRVPIIAEPDPEPAPTPPADPAPSSSSFGAGGSPSAVTRGPAVDLNGSAVVQLAAFRSQAQADQAWVQLAARHGDLFGDRPHEIVEADVNGVTWRRVRVLGFSTRADALAFCRLLEARDQACMATTR